MKININEKNNEKNIENIKNNLREFLTCLKNFKTSEYCNLDLNGEKFCLSTRSESASENWVFYDEQIIAVDDVNQAKNFFDERELKFIWPVLNFNSNQDIVLRQCGLNYAGDLLGMSLDVKNIKINEKYNNKIFFNTPLTDNEAKSWADTAWRGFGGTENAPENFHDFSCAVIRDKKLHMVKCVINNINNNDAGTYLTCDDNFNNTGVYYFAVPPKFRRKKLACDMMTSIVISAREHGKNKIVLQSTPAGVPFYKNFGFEEIFKIPVYTNTDNFEDVF